MVVDISEQVLEHLRARGPARANDIARELRVDRTTVNQALYSGLRGKVRQGRNYKWSLIAQPAPTTSAATTKQNSRSALFQYYLDCLAEDDDSGVSAFADSRFDLDYVELPTWPFDGEIDRHSNGVGKLVGRQRRQARRKALWLGYPSRIRHIRSRSGWEGAVVEPLLLWSQDSDASELTFLPEPIVNTQALKGLTAADNMLEEAAQIAEDLGLDEPDLPPIDEVVARLQEIRPEWDWVDKILPDDLRAIGDLRKAERAGIYNAAVVLIADRSPFTVGLERELAALKAVTDAEITSSALGEMLGNSHPSIELDDALLEPASLNSEQRVAVRQALSDPLTVITGPPGTGKSQVVTAILVNAAWRGLRVLFASKNNKAVDVVMERVNALSTRPVLLRLGTRALQEHLAQQITALLSARPTEDERNSYLRLVEKLQVETQHLQGLNEQLRRIIDLRNRVDLLEGQAETARDILPEETFRSAADFCDQRIEEAVQRLRSAIRRADRTSATIIERIIWSLLRNGRERVVKETVQNAVKVLSDLGLHSRGAKTPNQILSITEQYAQALDAARVYGDALRELASNRDTGAAAAELQKQSNALAGISGEVWSRLTELVSDRLDQQDRKALADYAAILRTISKIDEEGGTVARELWRRYYELAERSAKALPCWAVTSLAARGRVPFTAAQFDLLVIDEASQCDIASALPLMFRAKRVVVIGDPQQLRHISRISERRDQQLLVKQSLLDDPGPSWGYRANSLYELAAGRVKSGSVVVLRDHHRSHADIIGFSNSFFYGGKLRVATDYRRLKRPDGPALSWISAPGDVVRPPTGGAVNRVEAEAVVNELRRIAVTQRFSGEIGVVTPFRAQANLIEEIVNRDDALASVLASRNFISETAHLFQGDERDLIVFSPVVSRNTPAGAISFLKSQGNLFNVGITRARGALVVVGDATACAASEVSYLSAFARYVADRSHTALEVSTREEFEQSRTEYPPVARPELVSDWERYFYPELLKACFRPIPQYSVDQYVLDFALIRANGRRLDIEIDGEHYHREWNGELLRRDQLRNLRLIEMGWDVVRFWVYQIRDQLPACIARVAEWAEAADAQPNVVAGPETIAAQ
jgi:very-short-patch-repair endonuclease